MLYYNKSTKKEKKSMGRQFRDKVTVGRRIQRLKNGNVYVLERTTKYDPATKKTITIGQKLLGKIVKGSTEMVPTRAKRPDGAKSGIATRRHTGVTDVLDCVGRLSHVDEDVRRAFPDGGVADKILSIARYWTATGGQTLPRMAAWQAMHDAPYSGTMSDDVIGDLFQQVGVDEGGIQEFFRLRASRLGTNPVVAYDSTTVSTYSESLREARRGFNKDGDGLDTIKLLTLYSVREREPIAFAKEPGNIPDVISIGNAITQLEALGISKPLVVTDNGYTSEANMAEFALRNQKFLTLVDTDAKWVRDAVDSLQDELDGAEGVCPFDTDICGATLMTDHEFSKTRRRGRGGKSAGDEERFTKRLYVHVFRSPDVRCKRESAFQRRLFRMKAQLEDGVELKEGALRWANRYMTVSKQGRGGVPKVSFRNDAVRAARKYFGYFALATNQAMDRFEALRNYRLRERIEEHFGMDKRYFDGRRTRLWKADALRGRQFVQFVGLCYLGKFRRMVNDVEESLGVARPGVTKEQLRLEKGLAEWIRGRSSVDIFDWFDCIETTEVKTEAGRFRWSTESIRRDTLFLERLGVIKPVVQAATASSATGAAQ